MNAVKIKFEDFFNNVVCNNVEKKNDNFVVRLGYKYEHSSMFEDVYTYSLKDFKTYNSWRFDDFNSKQDEFKAHIKYVLSVLQKSDKCVRVHAVTYKQETEENETYYKVVL